MACSCRKKRENWPNDVLYLFREGFGIAIPSVNGFRVFRGTWRNGAKNITPNIQERMRKIIINFVFRRVSYLNCARLITASFRRVLRDIWDSCWVSRYLGLRWFEWVREVEREKDRWRLGRARGGRGGAGWRSQPFERFMASATDRDQSGAQRSVQKQKI